MGVWAEPVYILVVQLRDAVFCRTCFLVSFGPRFDFVVLGVGVDVLLLLLFAHFTIGFKDACCSCCSFVGF